MSRNWLKCKKNPAFVRHKPRARERAAGKRARRNHRAAVWGRQALKSKGEAHRVFAANPIRHPAEE